MYRLDKHVATLILKRIEGEEKYLEELLALLIAVESYGEKFSIRYEPRFYNRLKDSREKKDFIRYFREKYKGFITADTIISLFSHSYGLLQVLGYNFYFYGLLEYMNAKNFQCEVYKEEIQGLFFLHFIFRRDIYPRWIIEELKGNSRDYLLPDFAKKWNGSFKYAKRLINAYEFIRDTYDFKRFKYLAREILEKATYDLIVISSE